jgi:predicted RNase H-like HicB family nuclease
MVTKRFTLVIFRSNEDGCFLASVPEVPGVLTQGRTVQEARENAHDALALMLEAMQADGDPLPGESTVVEPLEVQVAA